MMSMKPTISVAFILACGFPVDAQIATSLNHMPDGLDEVRIRNNSATTLVASVVTGKLVMPIFRTQWPSLRNADPTAEAPFVVYSNPFVETATSPLPTKEERVLETADLQRPITGMVRAWSLEETKVAAGIFADGSTTGDMAWLRRLMLRRSNTLLAVEAALDTLSYSGVQNVSRRELIARFRKLDDSLNRWYLPPEQQIGRRVYQTILEELINTPNAPSMFISEEIAVLRKRRVALSESQPSLGTWGIGPNMKSLK